MAAHLLFKYFTRFQDGNVDRYTVNDQVRFLVTFNLHDVISNKVISGMDLVLCRNLLIYFQKELQEKALRNLYASLNPGGFLILGKTESIPPQMIDYFEVIDLRERIYRKQ
jgi:chemotaxis protein methyltransferase CheR